MRLTPLVFFGLLSFQPAWAAKFNDRIQKIIPVAVENLLANISRPDTQPGFVVASPSKVEPDYYYHWVRDAALTMQTVQDVLERETNPAQIARLEKILFDFAAFSRRNQETETLSYGYGEPKFNPDGSGYAGDWGRPQNDGAALRALTLIRFARRLLKDPAHAQYVREKLYDSVYPTNAVIKADLEFVAHNWRAPSFDLWEEVMADHFYTHMVQRAALAEGSRFAEEMGDYGAAAFYRAQAQNLEYYIESYWDPAGQFFGASRNYVRGVNYKYSNVDAAVILGLLHAHVGDGFLPFNDQRVLKTIAKIEDSFRYIYDINRNGQPGISVGRYPEDRYDGITTHTVGNPWFITTFAMAEIHYRLAKQLRGFRARSWRDKGDAYMARGLHHMNQSNFSMSEQFNRYTGHMQGAHDLTWSYASFISAAYAR